MTYDEDDIWEIFSNFNTHDFILYILIAQKLRNDWHYKEIKSIILFYSILLCHLIWFRIILG